MFVKSATEADRLEKTLESKCIAAITATEFMSPIELMDVKASWDSLVQSGKSGHCVLGEYLCLFQRGIRLLLSLDLSENVNLNLSLPLLFINYDWE